MYARARAGEITSFTGVDAPYEEPEAPELTVDTSVLDVDACVEEVVVRLP
jgi:adenylylsulfate kinase-like enzyme